ncbi:MAG: outer membrane protein transport protein [Candidatus Brocadiaceae bacterium]
MGTKKVFYLSILLFSIVIVGHTVIAQTTGVLGPPSVNAIPLPVGSGARALGMGGAFIAVADDATAASWNPGGLTQLERPEFSIVGSFLATQQDYDPGSTQVFVDEETVSRGDLNFASISYPFRILGKNLVASLNYQQVYDFHTNMNYLQIYEYKPTNTYEEWDATFESKGGIGALTPALSLQVTPKLSVGVSVNIYTDEFFGDYAWKQTSKTNITGKKTDTGETYTGFENRTDTYKNFQSVNATIGILWDVWEKDKKRLTLGAVYDTPFTADLDRKSEFFAVRPNTKNPPNEDTQSLDIDYPMSFGLGLSFRCNDALSFSLDTTWTDWSEYMLKNEFGDKWRPIGYAKAGRDIEDTYAVRYGTEYLLFQEKMIIPLRGGLFYEPRPSLDNPADFYGFSVGTGVTFQRFSIDSAYQFRWGNLPGEDMGQWLKGASFDQQEHLFLLSCIVYF